jgi:hypothetical protein
LWLENGALHLHSQLLNCGSLTMHCGWCASVSYSLPSEALMGFNYTAGENRIAWDQWPAGEILSLAGEKAPQGAWQINTLAGVLSHYVRGVVLARFSLGKQENPYRLNLDWRTAMVELSPGESIQVQQVIQSLDKGFR